jgi:hypothetical protein
MYPTVLHIPSVVWIHTIPILYVYERKEKRRRRKKSIIKQSGG